MRFYYSVGACSLASHICLELGDFKFEPLLMSLKDGGLQGADFLAKNPAGAVPLLEVPELRGAHKYISQNLAIISYLDALAPDKKIILRGDAEQTARSFEMLSFLVSDVHKSFGPVFHDGSGREGVEEQLDIFEKIMAHQPTGQQYSVGPQFSAPDALIFTFYHWARGLKFDLSRWPRFQAIARAANAQPAVERALTREGIAHWMKRI